MVRGYNERKLLEKIREGIASGGQADYLTNLREYCDDYILIIDDLGSSGVNQWREEIMIALVDFRYSLQLPTIFTSNLSKADFFATYDHRVGSRLFAEENTVLDLSHLQDKRQLGL